MWINRHYENLLRRMADQFPAVLVTGARQAGKTSILRRMYPNASYLSLDLPANAEAAETAPAQLLDQYPEPLIIDEIQYAPSLLRHLKNRLDTDRSPGRYFLTGSQVFPLMQGVSESLAGRCAVLNLHTLSRSELLDTGQQISETSYIFLGGYPELHVRAEADLWFPAYVATYLERDVRNILRVVDLQDFNRFLRACALRSSQVLNYSDLARDTGIAPNTAREMAWPVADICCCRPDRALFWQSDQTDHQGAKADFHGHWSGGVSGRISFRNGFVWVLVCRCILGIPCLRPDHETGRIPGNGHATASLADSQWCRSRSGPGNGGWNGNRHRV